MHRLFGDVPELLVKGDSNAVRSSRCQADLRQGVQQAADHAGPPDPEAQAKWEAAMSDHGLQPVK